MHCPKNWYERLEVDENNEVYRILTAQHKVNYCDVFKENSKGEHFCRNLYMSVCGGYVVAFPGERFSRYTTEIAVEEEWGGCGNRNVGTSRMPTSDEIDLLEDMFDGFNYVLGKWKDATLSMIFEVLPFWKEHKEVEFLCACGYWELATKKGFYKLSEKKRKEMIKWISKHSKIDFPILNMKEIQEVIKYKIPDEDYLMLIKVRNYCYNRTIKNEVAKYLVKQDKKFNLGIRNACSLYNDYKNMCLNLGKDLTNDYWKYPSNLQEAHDKVLQLCENIKNAQKQKELGKLEKLVGNISKFNSEVDGYVIYFSSDYADWKKQADTLHQCIIQCNYIGKMIRNQCRIAFIRKDGEPVATIELKENNRIGQFYANELHRGDCLPTDEVRQAVEKWVAGLPVLIKERKAA